MTKSSPTTTIINEPGRPPVKVRDSDLAKFGTKAERSTNLWTYAQRRPAPYEQTTETKIAKHSNDLKNQERGEIKIRHRQPDTKSVVSSVNSDISRALTVRKPVKPQLKRRRNTNPNESNENATTSDQPLISIVPAPLAPTPQLHRHHPYTLFLKTKLKAVNENEPSSTVLLKRIFPQPVLQAQRNQRNAEPRKTRKVSQSKIP